MTETAVDRYCYMCGNYHREGGPCITNTRAPRDPLLQERQKTHGSFKTNAEISQGLKLFMRNNGTTPQSHVHAEALDMIALKLSRILSGQANYRDHWDDIAGYAKLASEACDDKR